MLTQIISHTPVYVWAILAFLIYRGVIATRTREMAFKKMFIIPLVMLVLSLQDISKKFGADGVPLAMWALGAVATAALVWKFGKARVTAGSTPGTVQVRGSFAPLVLMMSIFATKYITAVAMAVQPRLAHDMLFSVAVCVLFGCFNGYFAGRLAKDVTGLQRVELLRDGLPA